MRKYFILATIVAVALSCTKEDVFIPDDSTPAENLTETPYIPSEAPTRRLVLGANSGKAETKAVLDGSRILWEDGDKIRLISEQKYGSVSTTLRITMDQPKSAIGIKSGSSAYGYTTVKYSDIHVEIGGVDVTSDIVSTSTSSNAFSVGMSNNSSNYQYAPANTEMQAKTFGDASNKTFLLARSSSSTNILSPDNKAVITLKDIQYRYGMGSWTYVNENTPLINGSSVPGGNGFNDVAKYEWLRDFNIQLDLTSEGGLPYGTFEGDIPVDADVDENTMAVYPVGAVSNYSNGTITVDIPQTQYYVENSFDRDANIMMGMLEAEDGRYNASFSNMMGIFQLALKGEGDEVITSLTLTDKGGKKLWGSASIPVASFEEGISTDMISGGGTSIVLETKGIILDENASVFNFVIPAGAFTEGFDVVLTTSDGRTKTIGTAKNNAISVNRIKVMPEMMVKDFPINDFSIENAALKEYLDMGPYSRWGASSYFLSNSTLNTPSAFGRRAMDQDTPPSFNADWSYADDVQTYYVTLTDRTKGEDIYTDRSVSEKEYAVMNMVPGHSYAIKVTDGSKLVYSGKFNATGRLRMVEVEDSWNFRDMGGWTGLDGHKVQYELLYRGSSLNGRWTKDPKKYSPAEVANPANYAMLSEKSCQQLSDMGIVGEIDLRATLAESQVGTTTQDSHVFAIGSHNDIQGWDYFHNMSNNAQSNSLKYYAVVQSVAWIIEHVMQDRPVVFHCKSGADRTGNLAYIIHSLLGVEEGDLALDYELTNMSHEQKVVKGSSELRGRYTDEKTGGFFGSGFTTLGKGSRQANAYFYLNQYFEEDGIAISSADLDAFIEKMLGMEPGSYVHPSFAKENGNNLADIYATPQTDKAISE